MARQAAIAAQDDIRDEASRALAAERERLERALAAQERIIAYRQSARWWLALPWLRMRMLWRK